MVAVAAPPAGGDDEVGTGLGCHLDDLFDCKIWLDGRFQRLLERALVELLEPSTATGIC